MISKSTLRPDPPTPRSTIPNSPIAPLPKLAPTRSSRWLRKTNITFIGRKTTTNLPLASISYKKGAHVKSRHTNPCPLKLRLNKRWNLQSRPMSRPRSCGPRFKMRRLFTTMLLRLSQSRRILPTSPACSRHIFSQNLWIDDRGSISINISSENLYFAKHNLTSCFITVFLTTKVGLRGRCLR